jgi:hypothetical protein
MRHPIREARLALCGFLLQAAPAAATDDAGKFAMKGAGLLPCQLYVDEREKRSNIYYLIGGWIEGYLSAYNRFAEDTYDVLSFESLELLLVVIDKHCRSHPKDRLHAVLGSIIGQTAPDRIRNESPPVEVVEGERRTALYRETIRRVQAELAKLGLYHGEVDGRFTDETRSAVIAFQSDLELETTGFPDQTTLWCLLR